MPKIAELPRPEFFTQPRAFESHPSSWKCLNCGHDYRAHKNMDDPYVGKSHRCEFCEEHTVCTCEAWR